MSTPMSLSMQGVRELISLYILFYLCITLIQTCLLPNINIFKDGAHGVILCLQKGLIDWLINWVLGQFSFALYLVPLPLKLIATIYLKYGWKWHFIPINYRRLQTSWIFLEEHAWPLPYWILPVNYCEIWHINKRKFIV
jgi:hypothetical protein